MPAKITRAFARDQVVGICEAVRTGAWDQLGDFAHQDGVLHVTDTIYLNGFVSMGQYFDHYLEYYDLDFLSLAVTTNGREAAAEIMLKVTYKKDKPGMPECTGQTTELPIAVFLTFVGDKIARGQLTFSLDEWMKAFSEPPKAAEGRPL